MGIFSLSLTVPSWWTEQKWRGVSYLALWGSISNKIAVLTLGFVSLMGSVNARRGSTIVGQTAIAMICHLNFASSTPALCLRPLPDVNFFLLFELRDLLKEQTPGMLCSFVTKLWHFQLDIADMKGTCLSFIARTAGIFELGCWILNSQVWKTSPVSPPLPHISQKKKKREKMCEIADCIFTNLSASDKVIYSLHSCLISILCIYFREELWCYLMSLT